MTTIHHLVHQLSVTLQAVWPTVTSFAQSFVGQLVQTIVISWLLQKRLVRRVLGNLTRGDYPVGASP